MPDKLIPFLKVISYLGLALTVIPSVFVAAGQISMDFNKNLMFLGTVLWFGTVVFWMNREK